MQHRSPKRRSPEVLSLRLPKPLRTRLDAALRNLPLFSRHAVALTALSAGLDRVNTFGDFAASAVIEGAMKLPERRPRA